MSSSSSVNYRTSESGMLEILHPETNSYTPVVTLLQLVDGFRVALASGDRAQMDAILNRAAQIEQVVQERVQELHSVASLINGKMSVAPSQESRSVADLLLELTNDMENLKLSATNLRDLSEQIWLGQYDGATQEGSVKKLMRIIDRIGDAILATTAVSNNQQTTNSKLNTIAGDVVTLVNRVVEVRDRISGGAGGRVRLMRSALNISNTYVDIEGGYVKLSLAVVAEPVTIGGVSLPEGSGVDEGYNAYADYPPISVDTRNGGRAIGWIYRVS